MAEEELQMPFWSHLAELRKRIVVSLIAVSIGFAMCFSFSEDLLAMLLLPMNMKIGLQSVFPYVTFTPNKEVQELYFTTLTEPFMSHLKIAFVAGIMLAVPVILHQIWKFISPGPPAARAEIRGTVRFLLDAVLCDSGSCSASFCSCPLPYRS